MKTRNVVTIDFSAPYLKTIMFIGLNPASENINDKTIIKCKNFAEKWEFNSMFFCNLYPCITRNPNEITMDGFEENFNIIKGLSRSCTHILFCWGNFEKAKLVEEKFIKSFSEAICFGKNKDGSPKHPLYVPYTKFYEPYSGSWLG